MGLWRVRHDLAMKTTTRSMIMGTSLAAQDSTLPVQEAWVPSLARELDPTLCSYEFKCGN